MFLGARGWLRATIPSIVASVFHIWYVGIPKGAEHRLQGHRGLVMMLRNKDNPLMGRDDTIVRHRTMQRAIYAEHWAGMGLQSHTVRVSVSEGC
jgi:hypothetical protein